MWIIAAVIIAALWFVTRKMAYVPKGGQNIAEMYVDFMNNFSRNQIGRAYKTFAPYMGMLLIFIVMSNIIAIFNIIPSGETLAAILGDTRLEGFKLALEPPTKNFNVTLCLAAATMLVFVVSEFRFKGTRGWLRSFYRPSPIFGFVKILDYVVRPLSLCLRLFGNMLGGFIVMALLYSVAPLFIPAVVGIYFDLFDGVLQAYVFVVLTSLYMGEATETEIEEEAVKSSEEANI
jgi:F-type H+-transporting ATPase subunit a